MDKKQLKDPLNWLRIFMGFIFLLAALFRILNFSNAHEEFAALNLPLFILPIVILFELGCGILLIINKYIKQTLIFISIFLSFAVLLGIIIYLPNFPQNLGKLFVYDVDPTDIFLHFTFLAIVAYLFFSYKKQ